MGLQTSSEKLDIFRCNINRPTKHVERVLQTFNTHYLHLQVDALRRHGYCWLAPFTHMPLFGIDITSVDTLFITVNHTELTIIKKKKKHTQILMLAPVTNAAGGVHRNGKSLVNKLPV